MKYKNSNKEFEVRVVAVMMLSYYLNDQYIDLVLNVTSLLNLEYYNQKMAVTWLLSTAVAKYPEKVLKYMQNDKHMDSWTYNKMIQKSIESYRVSDSIKEQLRSMRK